MPNRDKIVLDKVVEYLQTKHENIHFASREIAYAKNLLNKIDEWIVEVANAE